MKNEAKEEESVDGNLEASTMTTTGLPQKLQQQPLTTSEPTKNQEQPTLAGAATHEMFMSSETGGEVKDGPQNEVVSMKDKYAGKAPF
jgi:hypothetical protein